MIPVYMDNHSTTRVDPRVVEAMLPYFSDIYGNAGSMGHAFGEQARVAVEDARGRIAFSLGTTSDSIVFTSGATESNNLAISGVAGRASRRDNHWISVRTEHHSVLEPLRRLSGSGHQVTLLEVEPSPNSRAGWLDPQRVADALRDQTCLVSVMLANNEIGVVQPLAEIAHLCHQRGVLLHCDATQAVGKLSLDVDKLGVDLLSFSAHKFYGPKGIGGLVVRRNRPATRLQPQIVGGGQQAGRRSGTLNVPAIVGMACALELCLQHRRGAATAILPVLRRPLAEPQSLQGTLTFDPNTLPRGRSTVSGRADTADHGHRSGSDGLALRGRQAAQHAASRRRLRPEGLSPHARDGRVMEDHQRRRTATTGHRGRRYFLGRLTQGSGRKPVPPLQII